MYNITIKTIDGKEETFSKISFAVTDRSLQVMDGDKVYIYPYNNVIRFVYNDVDTVGN